MLCIYLLQPNCIILAISPANQDIATSDAIKLAREVDPSGMLSSLSFLLFSFSFLKIFVKFVAFQACDYVVLLWFE